MLKKDVVKKVAAETEFNQDQVSEIFDKIVDAIREGMIQGEKIRINGFGVFNPYEMAAHMGRNPRTGESMEIPAKKGYRLSLSKSVKEALNR